MRLNEDQTALLLEMIHFAFLDIRALCYLGNAAQAADLADAFHNLPKDLKAERVVLEQFREEYLKPYHEKYPGNTTWNYVKLINQILEHGDNDPSAN
jgi:hypothetical protein